MQNSNASHKLSSLFRSRTSLDRSARADTIVRGELLSYQKYAVIGMK